MKTKKEAEKIARKVAAKLPNGWRCNIWENLGWHVEWHKGAISLHYEWPERYFWCMAGMIDSCTGDLDLSRDPIRRFDDPIAAIKHICRYAKRQIKKEWLPIINSVDKVLKSVEG